MNNDHFLRRDYQALCIASILNFVLSLNDLLVFPVFLCVSFLRDVAVHGSLASEDIYFAWMFGRNTLW